HEDHQGDPDARGIISVRPDQNTFRPTRGGGERPLGADRSGGSGRRQICDLSGELKTLFQMNTIGT
ncbi:MAG: hypothetical protein ACKVG6_11635, partial [Alphaproteobacteria bacterium]